MEIMWWGYSFGTCKKCDTPLICTGFDFSEDEELRFDLICPDSGCRMEGTAIVKIEILMAKARKADTEKAIAESIKTALNSFGKPQPVRPPVKQAVNPAELLTDEAFLHELGISSADIPLLPPPEKEEE